MTANRKDNCNCITKQVQLHGCDILSWNDCRFHVSTVSLLFDILFQEHFISNPNMPQHPFTSIFYGLSDSRIRWIGPILGAKVYPGLGCLMVFRKFSSPTVVFFFETPCSLIVFNFSIFNKVLQVKTAKIEDMVFKRYYTFSGE